jgi:hypothetical protein
MLLMPHRKESSASTIFTGKQSKIASGGLTRPIVTGAFMCSANRLDFQLGGFHGHRKKVWNRGRKTSPNRRRHGGRFGSERGHRACSSAAQAVVGQADEAFHCRHAMPNVVFWVIRRYKFVTDQTSSSAAADLPIINY